MTADQLESSAGAPNRPWFLLGRPAKEGDVSGIMEIARDINIASMVANETFQKTKITKSQATLENEASWKDGLLFLVTELCNYSEPVPPIIGSACLNRGAGGHWKKRKRTRFSNDVTITSKYLTFESRPQTECSLEFSSNCVLPEYRKGDLKIGNFQTTARIIFLLMHRQNIVEDIGDISFLFANLLTRREEGVFPFYQKVVRPLLGDIAYEQADKLRYQGSDFLETLLLRSGKQHEGPQLPVHLIELAIGDKLGAVREETLGAQIALSNFGFQQVNKFDALDGGRYMEISFDALAANADPRVRKARRESSGELANPGTYCTFAPFRKTANFVCARALARIDEETLWIDEAAFNKLELNSREDVMVVAPRVQSSRASEATRTWTPAGVPAQSSEPQQPSTQGINADASHSD